MTKQKQQKLGHKKWEEKNNCMHISSDKQVKLHARRPRQVKERDNLRETVNLF